MLPFIAPAQPKMYFSVEKYLQLSAADIYKELKKRNAAALRGFNPNHLAQVLIKLGVERKHTEYGNVYLVVRR